MMKSILTCLLLISLVIYSGQVLAQKKDQKKSAQEEQVTQPLVLTSWMDTISYLVGHDLGIRMKSFIPDADIRILNLAIQDGFDGKESLFTRQQSDSIMTIFQGMLSTEQQKEEEEAMQQNKAASAIFLAENRTKEGVVELPSGLQYQVITEGEGDSPSATSQVTVHYTGKLMDGTVFDSSYERGEPITLGLDGVIPGWTEGLQLMKPGGKSVLFIPPHLGYGDHGAGPIPPGSLLIFEVELIRIAD